MAKNDGFFRTRQGAAILKHGILKRYLPKFVGKTGKFARDNRVVHIDGFAGTGVYDDGAPGSPRLAADLAMHMIKNHREIECFYIEKDRAVAARLTEVLKDLPHRGTIREGTAAAHVPEIVRECGSGTPLFAFLDPYGLVALPFDLVVGTLRRFLPPGVTTSAPTEVLLNFSITALRRVGGFLATPVAERSTSAKTAIENLNAALGGDWWHDVWLSGAADRERRVLRDYVRRVRELCANGYIGWVVPVSDTWDGPPAYLLVFFTRSRDGIWEFNEALSLAREDHAVFCREGRPRELVDLRRSNLVGRLTRNLAALVAERAEFTVLDVFPRVFAGVEGDARETHLREALKDLHARGEIEHNGKGKELERAMIRRSRRDAG